MFDYRVWSGARSGYIAMFSRDGEIVFATTAGLADVERGIEHHFAVLLPTMTAPGRRRFVAALERASAAH